MSTTQTNAEFITLNTRGTKTTLRSSIIASNDWVLKTILTSSIPWDKLDGGYYVDVDPDSFRLILALLRLNADDQNEKLEYLSAIELNLLADAACYLGLVGLADMASKRDPRKGIETIAGSLETIKTIKNILQLEPIPYKLVVPGRKSVLKNFLKKHYSEREADMVELIKLI